MSAVLADGGTLILAGLLDNQADRVAAAYRAQGLRLVDRIDSPEKADIGLPCGSASAPLRDGNVRAAGGRGQR